MTLTSDDQEGQARLKELRKGLETHGWSEGRNIQLDVRWAGADTKRLQVDAAELIKLKPEVVVAGGSRALIALQELTKETPIVFVAAAGSIAGERKSTLITAALIGAAFAVSAIGYVYLHEFMEWVQSKVFFTFF